jgi:hypothetical protein
MNLKQLTAGAIAALSLGFTALPAHAYILAWSSGAGGQLNLKFDDSLNNTAVFTQAPAFSGDTVTTPSGTGWYSTSGVHFSGNDYYAVAAANDPLLSQLQYDPQFNYDNGLDYTDAFNNFFVFDISQITQPVLSASITLWQGSGGPSSPGASANEWLRLGAYLGTSASVSALESDHSAGEDGATIFSNLGSGEAYGYHQFGPSDDDTNVEFALNQAFLNAINTARGAGDQYIVLGGRIGTRFEATGVVPEPATWAMMILGFLGAGVALRARRRTLAEG